MPHKISHTTQLNCSVTNCASNKDNMCCLAGIQIEGRQAPRADETCCFSYVPLLESTNPPRELCSADKPTMISCTATLCSFNEHEACAAREITVDAQDNVRHCTQTRCQSFRKL